MIKNNKRILNNSDIQIGKNKLEFGKTDKKYLMIDKRDFSNLSSIKSIYFKTKVALFDESVEN